MSPEVLQQFDLSQCALGKNLLAEDIGDLLDGDTLVRLVVHGSTVGRRKVSNGGAKIKAFSQAARIGEGFAHFRTRTRQCHKRLDQAPL